MDEKESIKVSLGTTVCIILIILLLVVCGALYYFGFVQKDKQLEKIETEKTQVETQKANLEKQIIVIEKEVELKNTEEKENTKKTSEVPTTDLVAIYCDANNKKAELFFSYIKDGKVYYFHERESDYEGEETGQYYKFSVGLMGQYNYEEKMKQCEEIENAKRIKMYNGGTGVLPVIYVVTEDGKVYAGSFFEHEFALHIDNRLKEYEVEDIISKTGELADEFELLLKDGTIKTVTVEL